MFIYICAQYNNNTHKNINRRKIFFLKKVKKFGSLKNSSYLCIRFKNKSKVFFEILIQKKLVIGNKKTNNFIV